MRFSLSVAEVAGARTVLIGAADLCVPFYDPAANEHTETAKRLVNLLRKADGLILASPSYTVGFRA